MSGYRLSLALLFTCSLWSSIRCVELTFELPDNEKQCFYESLTSGSNFLLEYQVVTGGDHDVDARLKDPQRQVIYEEAQKEYDQIERSATITGVYEICFSNEFSTFTHKVIYMKWQVNGEPEHEINGTREQGIQGPLTMLESGIQKIHTNLEAVIDHQTHRRLTEASDRSQAEDLHERVQLWSLGQTVLIIFVSIGTVLILRSFFPDRRYPSRSNWSL